MFFFRQQYSLFRTFIVSLLLAYQERPFLKSRFCELLSYWVTLLGQKSVLPSSKLVLAWNWFACWKNWNNQWQDRHWIQTSPGTSFTLLFLLRSVINTVILILNDLPFFFVCCSWIKHQSVDDAQVQPVWSPHLHQKLNFSCSLTFRRGLLWGFFCSGSAVQKNPSRPRKYIFEVQRSSVQWWQIYVSELQKVLPFWWDQAKESPSVYLPKGGSLPFLHISSRPEASTETN